MVADRAPTVSAGINQTITLPGGATLAGLVTDPGSPSSPVTSVWSKVSGPGTVTFANAAAAHARCAEHSATDLSRSLWPVYHELAVIGIGGVGQSPASSRLSPVCGTALRSISTTRHA